MLADYVSWLYSVLVDYIVELYRLTILVDCIGWGYRLTL